MFCVFYSFQFRLLLTGVSQQECGKRGRTGERSRDHSRRQLTANPASVSFGSVAVGSDGLQSITLTNSGTASITISSAGASGTGFAIAGLSTPMTLSAGQTVLFSASFTPTSARQGKRQHFD